MQDYIRWGSDSALGLSAKHSVPATPVVQNGGGEVVPRVGEVVVSLLVHRVHMLCKEVGHPLPVLLGGLAGIGSLQRERRYCQLSWLNYATEVH